MEYPAASRPFSPFASQASHSVRGIGKPRNRHEGQGPSTPGPSPERPDPARPSVSEGPPLDMRGDPPTLAAMLLRAAERFPGHGISYLRLDGWTNGRFTRWVCIIATAIVALAGLGWLTSN